MEQNQKLNFRKIAKQAAQILKEKKGRDIIMLDVRKISDFADYLVIASGTSETHIKTLFSAVEEKLTVTPYKKEKKPKTKWAVLDYGGVVIHIMHDSLRRFYNLESHWAVAKKVVIKSRSVRKN
ncbi:MAG: ribosome silencing factor [Elusimicrobiota bacterium]